ncbi:MAG: SHOCT domain-containing protein [Sulfuricaulis sp.]
MQTGIVIAMATMLVLGSTGCSSKAGNIAIGAGAAGAAYEYQNKRAMDELNRDYQAGTVSKEEYERRKNEIEKRSIVQ